MKNSTHWDDRYLIKVTRPNGDMQQTSPKTACQISVKYKITQELIVYNYTCIGLAECCPNCELHEVITR